MSKFEYSSEQIIHAATLNVDDIDEHRRVRANNAATELARMQFDVIGLQEVTPEHQAACMAELPGYIQHFELAYGHEKSGLMTMVDPIVFDSAETYQPNGQLTDQALLVTELTSRTGQELVFVNGHLPSEIYLEGHRIAQTRRLVKFLDEQYPQTPVIIARDTNSTKTAPLSLYTRMAGYKSAHKAVHGKEPKRTHPSKYGDQLIKNRLDGNPHAVRVSRALRLAGNALRKMRVLEEDGWDSPHAGCDIDRVSVNGLVHVLKAGIFADDRQPGVGPISDHIGLEARVKLLKPQIARHR